MNLAVLLSARNPSKENEHTFKRVLGDYQVVSY